MEGLVQVKLRDSGTLAYYLATDIATNMDDCVIIEAERGLDYAQVVSEQMTEVKGILPHPLRKIVRVATENDLKQIEENKKKIKEVIRTCTKKIEEHKLDMKLVDAEYAFDRSKIIFYFTAEGRIDFRDLVKDLAKIFKARIELRQIGVRDEAKLFGGYGSCGRELCCKGCLKVFEPVTIKMAKQQGLPLNPPKLSGVCGRLMCCLSFEHKTYKELSKKLPKEGEKITTPEGKGKVLSVNILKREVIAEVGEEGKQIKISFK
ncbi:MAG: stage 0 sporulation family protein [Candidatus Omnitrophica bacterium]|nr:stage 0 sporulation family protein [Candidatus Omnitrophota bacterium]